MEQNVIIVKQLPIIVYEKIENVGKEVEKRIQLLDLDKQIVTEDTKKALKDTRAELNKEFEVFERQRKEIKAQIAKPYQDFELAYNQFIKAHYESADATLKVKLTAFDNKLKQDKEERAKAYFLEKAQETNIDFFPFQRLNLKINTTTSDKSIRDHIDACFSKVQTDLDLVQSIPESDEFKAEVIAEYKQTLDINSSLRNAQYRKQQKEIELQRIAKQKEQETIQKAQEEAKKTEEAPLKAPQEVKKEVETLKKEQILEASFVVRGTLTQLKALKEYIINNNIEIL